MRYETLELKNRGYGRQKAVLTSYIQETVTVEPDFQRPAVIICPGGGYEFTSARESEPVALAFLEKGYQAFILDYTVIDPEETKELLPYPLYDLAYAVHYVREHCKEFTIDSSRISILGCSAGGHLCASYCHAYAQDWFQKEMGLKKEDLKPDRAILCYPVIDFTLGWPKTQEQILPITKHPEAYKAQNLVSGDTPATFIWHTVSDEGVPAANTLQYVQALVQNGIDYECHMFHQGRHGLSLATAQSAKTLTEDYINPHVAKWFGLMLDWLDDTNHVNQLKHVN